MCRMKTLQDSPKLITFPPQEIDQPKDPNNQPQLLTQSVITNNL